MANSITNRQMFFILILILTSYTSVDLPKIVAQSAGRNGWMLVLAVALVFGLAAAAIASLNNRFRGKVMFDYSQEIAGKLASRLIAVYYILYFIVVGVYLKLRLVNFLSSNFLPKTPQAVMLAVSVALFAFVSFKGITNVARLFELYGFAFLLTTISICAIMLPQGMIYNIRPLINPDKFKDLPAAIPKLLFPYGGIEVLLIVPFAKCNKRAARVAFLTLVFIGLLYVLIVDSTISILGINNTAFYSDAFIEAIKVVNIPIIERPDIFYLTVGLTSLFAGMIMVFLAILEFACKLFSKVGRHIITLVCSVVLYTLCMFALGIKNISEVLDACAPYLVLVSSILLPGTLLILAMVKGKRGDAP